MTICLDLSAAAQERAGLGRYAARLGQALLALGVPLTAFINDPRESRLAPPLSSLPTRSVHLARKPWRLRAAATYFGGPSLDFIFEGTQVYHATEHLLPRLKRVPSVFTLHDIAYLRYPQYHLLQNRLFLRWMMPRFLRQADHIIAISESTRRDALQHYRLDPAKIGVIPEGVEPRFTSAVEAKQLDAVRRAYDLPARFILFVGTIEPRKNLPTLLEAYAALRSKHPDVGLVIAGGKGWLYQSFFDRLTALGLPNVVKLTGFVTDEQLPALLNAAEVFAFPSHFEGFGLPPLEAMACGVPVVCSNASSLPEVVGDAGLLVPPDDSRAWVEALDRVLSNPGLRLELRGRGLARARQFTWEAAARQTLAVYQRVAEVRRAPGA
jgi:glycosyltransferase involved in cell wall biosynthesis